MNIGDIFEKKFKKRENLQVTASPEHDRYPFDQQFQSFLNFSRTLEADEDVVDGKQREYISTLKLLPACREAFGDAAPAAGTVRYRLKHIQPAEYPEDLLVADGEYFVNRLNTKLLKEIYFPKIDQELREVVQEVHMGHNDLSIVRDWGIHDHEPMFPKKPGTHDDEEYHEENEYLAD